MPLLGLKPKLPDVFLMELNAGGVPMADDTNYQVHLPVLRAKAYSEPNKSRKELSFAD